MLAPGLPIDIMAARNAMTGSAALAEQKIPCCRRLALLPCAGPKNEKTLGGTVQASKAPYSDGFHTYTMLWARDAIVSECARGHV